MKTVLLFKLFLFLVISPLIIAQSDFRITQEFKSRHRSFEIAIEYAKTTDELRKIEKEINEFKNEFKGNTELLNRALYPGNFETSFDILAKKVEYTNKKLTEISGLETKVTQLESDYIAISGELQKLSTEIISLKNTNSALMSELRAFKSGYGGSKESIDSLKGLVNELRDGISKRDTLIKEIMDNIFMTAGHRIESLDDAEKMSIRTKVQGTSLIDNIRNLISDNIEFLDASLFTRDDLSALGSEFTDFEERWKNFGPKLFDIYSADKQNQDKLLEIDSLMLVWDTALDVSAWKAIRSIFQENNIALEEFYDDSTFVVSAVSFIESEIKKLSENPTLESEQNFVYFSDRTWNETIKSEWMTFLLSEDLISEGQIVTIDLKIEQWEDNLSGSKSYFIYAIIILLAIIIIVSIVILRRRNRSGITESVHADDLKSSSEKKLDNDIDEDEEFIDDEK